jgi:hypothetical protein
MYPACDAAAWPLASMRSAVGFRLSGRARSSPFFSGSTDPGPTGHAITSKNATAARGNLRHQGQLLRICPRRAPFTGSSVKRAPGRSRRG